MNELSMRGALSGSVVVSPTDKSLLQVMYEAKPASIPFAAPHPLPESSPGSITAQPLGLTDTGSSLILHAIPKERK